MINIWNSKMFFYQRPLFWEFGFSLLMFRTLANTCYKYNIEKHSFKNFFLIVTMVNLFNKIILYFYGNLLVYGNTTFRWWMDYEYLEMGGPASCKFAHNSQR